ncbi:hypothetical protein DF268_36540 [Streptomyces sp. V2]|uniref:hypothetical protein n=1 Tax=Streptomyces TaxID=1883 RepID=UPI0006EBCEE9|nr:MULTISPECIES: hypothetical protein [Streptomyces]PWG08671.1 hypothetical protein DF268_36540 [Streptomyces sp. V2]
MALGILVCVAVGISGCSSERQGRDFSVPKDLCGVSVPEKALGALLPSSGERVDVAEGASAGGSVETCEVSVDGDAVLSVERQRVDASRSAWNIASYDHRIGQVETADDETVAYAGRAAVSVVSCGEEKAVSSYVRVLAPGRSGKKAMRELISGYTASLRGQDPCG